MIDYSIRSEHLVHLFVHLSPVHLLRYGHVARKPPAEELALPLPADTLRGTLHFKRVNAPQRTARADARR